MAILIDYTIASYVWIPRIKDIFNGNDMTYLPMAGGLDWRFFSDTASLAPPAKPGQTYFQLVLPPWFPRKALFSRIVTVFQVDPPTQVSMNVWVDPKGISYNTGTPPGGEVGSDITRQKQMAVWVKAGAVAAKEWIKDVPVPFDRDALDKLTVDVSCPAGSTLTAIGVCFEWLVPNTIQPAPLVGA